jgi:methanogenic corrinoid protein MtbC1
VVEDTVIPHLLLKCSRDKGERVAGQTHVDTLARLLLSHDADAARQQVTALLQAGMTTDRVLHDLVTPAAHRLGTLWFHDSATFVDVAVAMARLTGLVRQLCDIPRAHDRLSGKAPTALFVAPDGERHGLGLLIATHDFRHAGWRVAEAGATCESPGDAVAHAACDLVGLSLGSERHVAEVAAVIDEIRHRAGARQPIIMVGGAVVPSIRGCLLAMGADYVVNDSREAVRLANRHLLQRSAAGKLGAVT